MTNLPPPWLIRLRTRSEEEGLKRRCDYDLHSPGPLISGVRDFLFKDPGGIPAAE